jgi:hypothetical protein
VRLWRCAQCRCRPATPPVEHNDDHHSTHVITVTSHLSRRRTTHEFQHFGCVESHAIVDGEQRDERLQQRRIDQWLYLCTTLTCSCTHADTSDKRTTNNTRNKPVLYCQPTWRRARLRHCAARHHCYADSDADWCIGRIATAPCAPRLTPARTHITRHRITCN